MKYITLYSIYLKTAMKHSMDKIIIIIIHNMAKYAGPKSRKICSVIFMYFYQFKVNIIKIQNSAKDLFKIDLHRLVFKTTLPVTIFSETSSILGSCVIKSLVLLSHLYPEQLSFNFYLLLQMLSNVRLYHRFF